MGATGASIAGFQSQQDDLSALTEQLDTIHQEKLRVQERLRYVKRRQRQVRNELAHIDARLNRTESRLYRVASDIRRARADLGEASEQCAVAEARLAGHREDVSARLVAIYQQGEVTPIEVALDAASFSDFANRLYLLDQVVGSDAELLHQYEDAHQVAKAQRAELEEREERLARLRTRISSERSRARKERRYTESMKRSLLRDRAAWEQAFAELEQDSREVEEMLHALQQGPEGRARLTKPWTGKLRWPLRGRISSGYGRRTHPIYRVRKMHTGLDIAAPNGTRIRAAAPGKVVHAARWGGYGKCIIIDHGGELATLYAHCSRLAVENGATVEQGEIIGYVGSTGLSTGPHLHFEVRRDGRHVNPMPLLP